MLPFNRLRLNQRSSGQPRRLLYEESVYLDCFVRSGLFRIHRRGNTPNIRARSGSFHRRAMVSDGLLFDGRMPLNADQVLAVLSVFDIHYEHRRIGRRSDFRALRFPH